jgi:uncharacterized protein YigA (DUF484 family)
LFVVLTCYLSQALSRNYAVLAERAAIGEHLFRGISDLQSAMADAAASVGSTYTVPNSARRNFRFRAAVFAVLAANRLKQHDRCSWFGLGERLFGDGTAVVLAHQCFFI